ncbi:hypothetical protein pipiens_010493 [Culex pipiens pipiens]|uniref:Cuticular protein n=1 Tax=Culex pipiens pipiens TaxID=38569 RepID=A0ABD1DA25_CULPP
MREKFALVLISVYSCYILSHVQNELCASRSTVRYYQDYNTIEEVRNAGLTIMVPESYKVGYSKLLQARQNCFKLRFYNRSEFRFYKSSYAHLLSCFDAHKRVELDSNFDKRISRRIMAVVPEVFHTGFIGAHIQLLVVVALTAQLGPTPVQSRTYSYSNFHESPFDEYEDISSTGAHDDSITLGSESDEVHHNAIVTHSQKSNRYSVPIYQKIGVPVPHPVPVAVPQYVKINVPQPYPVQVNVEQQIKVPVYKIVPKIIERPVPYTVEKSYPVEVEKPFPVEVLKKIEVPVPKPYPVPVPIYRHVTQREKTHRSWRY